MFKILTTALCGLLLSTGAQAQTSSWVCNVSLELKGDSNYYRLYGRDSWRGVGEMDCATPDQKLEKQKVEVVFNSFTGNVGANEDSILRVTLALSTLTSPGSFEATNVIKNPVADPYLRWEFSSQLSAVRGVVWTPMTGNLQSSLSQGSLLIRTAVQTAQ